MAMLLVVGSKLPQELLANDHLRATCNVAVIECRRVYCTHTCTRVSDPSVVLESAAICCFWNEVHADFTLCIIGLKGTRNLK